MLGVHSKEALFTKYMYAIIKYILLSRKPDLINRGLLNYTFQGSDFTRNLESGGDILFHRFLTVSGKVEDSWTVPEILYPVERVRIENLSTGISTYARIFIKSLLDEEVELSFLFNIFRSLSLDTLFVSEFHNRIILQSEEEIRFSLLYGPIFDSETRECILRETTLFVLKLLAEHSYFGETLEESESEYIKLIKDSPDLIDEIERDLIKPQFDAFYDSNP